MLMLLTQLIFVFLAVAVSATPSANVSAFDSFRAIALKVPPKPGPPICCLKPLPSDPSEDDMLLLSFEEWKVKQAEARGQREAGEDSPNHNHSSGSFSDVVWSGTASSVVDARAATPTTEWESGPVAEPISPHFRVPIIDRFNYASLDCSARIHHSHRSAKSSSSILSSKRDKYMLSPCRGKGDEKQFVVLELCDDIRIDTVQLANFEFFSGVFKDFSVSVAKNINTGWTDAGRYRAKNTRGVQSFHTPPTLRDFYRFIRIDFHSFYGSEYYCPVSLLRVYGLTHLEQWKWDMWEAEGNAQHGLAGDKAVEVIVTRASPLSSHTGGTPITEAPAVTRSTEDPTATLTDNSSIPSATASNHPNETVSPVVSQSSPTVESTERPSSLPSGDIVDPTPTSLHPTSSNSEASHMDDEVFPSTNSQSSETYMSSSEGPESSVSDASIPPTSTPSPVTFVAPTVTLSPISYAHTTSTHSPPPPPPPPPGNPFMAGGGESIYRTIMNRLTALESNHTLYTRYIEDQISGIRGVLRRLSEDVGRLEGIGKAQSQTYARTVKEWEKHRARLDADFAHLLHRVDYLTDEVILEKRLGIAQLCLLLAVLIFMGLTRGSRMSEADLQSLLAQRIADRDRKDRGRGVKEWGRRHLSSISGEWVKRFRSRSPLDVDAQKENMPPQPHFTGTSDDRVAFPSHSSTKALSSGRRHLTHKPRSRTSSLRSPLSATRHYHNQANNPPTGYKTAPILALHVEPRPSPQNPRIPASAIATTGSWSGALGRDLASGAKSAKRWARSAHLHEIKVKGGSERQQLIDHIDDVFTSRPHTQVVHTVQSPRPRSQSLSEEGDGWVDTDSSESDDETPLKFELQAVQGRTSS